MGKCSWSIFNSRLDIGLTILKNIPENGFNLGGQLQKS